jgi:hypothetical protein
MTPAGEAGSDSRWRGNVGSLWAWAHRTTAARYAWFGAGLAVLLTGVIMHVVDWASTADMGFMMAGMAMGGKMSTAMALLPIGLLFCMVGLAPGTKGVATAEKASVSSDPLVRKLAGLQPDAELGMLDDAAFSAAHWRVCVVLTIATAIDIMKPNSLGFVLPGMKAEYELSNLVVSAFPTIALAGTVAGSVLWGWAADVYGRRPSIVLASLLFIATTACGAMPSFRWNLVMCGFMGLGAGGMLPIVYTLLSEMMPGRWRGVSMMLVGGIGTAGGYAAASGLSSLLVPLTSWRILWMLNLPTGLIIIALMKFIPESPRFLLARGRYDECAALLRAFNPTLAVAERADGGHGAGERPEAQQSHAPPHAAAEGGEVADAEVSMFGLAAEAEAEAVELGCVEAPVVLGAARTSGPGPELDDAGGDNDADEPSAPLAPTEGGADPLGKQPGGPGHVVEMSSSNRIVLPSRMRRLRAAAVSPTGRLTAALAAYAFAWGLCNNGFVLWIPGTLRQLGVGGVDALLAYSALISFACAPVAAAMYSLWGTKRTLLAAGGGMAAFLMGFAIAGTAIASEETGVRGMLFFLLVGLTATSTVLISVLSSYAAEVGGVMCD